MTETIRLGGREFTLRPPTLGQLRHLLDALDMMAGASGGALIEAAAKLVASGLAAACPDMTADAVLDLSATLPELNAAVAAILKLAGLSPVGEAGPRVTPGEAAMTERAETAPASGSAPFTALSPPAAAIPIA